MAFAAGEPIALQRSTSIPKNSKNPKNLAVCGILCGAAEIHFRFIKSSLNRHQTSLFRPLSRRETRLAHNA